MNGSELVMEHRWGTRVSLDCPASLRRLYGLESEARIRDASLSGAFIETTDRLTRFSRIAIRSLSSDTNWIEAWVVRTEADGAGLEWLEPGSQMALELMQTQRRVRADRRSRMAREDRPTFTLDWSVATDGLSRARSEVEYGEFDVPR